MNKVHHASARIAASAREKQDSCKRHGLWPIAVGEEGEASCVELPQLSLTQDKDPTVCYRMGHQGMQIMTGGKRQPSLSKHTGDWKEPCLGSWPCGDVGNPQLLSWDSEFLATSLPNLSCGSLLFSGLQHACKANQDITFELFSAEFLAECLPKMQERGALGPGSRHDISSLRGKLSPATATFKLEGLPSTGATWWQTLSTCFITVVREGIIPFTTRTFLPKTPQALARIRFGLCWSTLMEP